METNVLCIFEQQLSSVYNRKGGDSLDYFIFDTVNKLLLSKGEKFMKDKINEVIRRIQYLLPEVEVTSQKVQKNNDVILTGVVLKSQDNNIAPVFYIDDMIENGWSYDRIAMDICRSYQAHDGAEYSSITLQISDYETMSHMLTLQLINRTMNESLLEDIPYIPFLEDLAVIVLIDLEKDLRACATVKVSSQILELWGVSFDEVYHKAYLNLTKEEAIVSSMSDVLSELGYEEIGELDINLYILTNESRIHGATMMLRESLLKELTEKFNSDLVIIPSSIHELLLVPTNDSYIFDKNIFDNMVREVNESQVDPVEILSDHIYLYSRDGGWYNFN